MADATAQSPMLLALLLMLASCPLGRAAGDLTAAQHMEEGGKALMAADFTAALEHYHHACDKDPKNFQPFYKRATVYLATGRTRQAIKDLSQVLELKPAFDQARTKRAELYFKDGLLSEAKADYEHLSTPEARETIGRIDMAQTWLLQGKQLMQAGRCEEVIKIFSQLIELVPNAASVRLDRAKCYEQRGQLGEAIGDVMRASKLLGNEAEPYFLLSRLHMQTGARADAMAAIRECVKLDPDHKAGYDLYKQLKKFNKAYDTLDEQMQGNRFQEALESVKKLRDMSGNTPFYVAEFSMVECTCHTKLNNADMALQSCSKTLELDPRRVDALLHRATAHEVKEDFEAAIKDIKAAGEIEEKSQRVAERLQRAERLLKQSKKRDYYKILGVPRNADKRQINKAYRELAQKWHPDRFDTEAEKKTAEAKFMDIAAAKEVLSDPDKRQIFDNGEDPLDAEQGRERAQRGGGGFPFSGFHHHGGGGGGGGQRFHFKFQ